MRSHSDVNISIQRNELLHGMSSSSNAMNTSSLTSVLHRDAFPSGQQRLPPAHCNIYMRSSAHFQTHHQNSHFLFSPSLFSLFQLSLSCRNPTLRHPPLSRPPSQTRHTIPQSPRDRDLDAQSPKTQGCFPIVCLITRARHSRY